MRLCDTRVTGPVSLTGGSSVALGDPTTDCGPNVMVGPVTVTGTATVIAGNQIVGTLACSANDPAPTNHGAPNTVVGPELGQCQDL